MNGFSREIPQTAVDRFAQVSSTTSNWISNDAKSSLRMMKKDYGNITKFPALLGRPEMVMTFDVEDAEKVFRFDGQYPFRRAIETLTHYRQKLRPDIYGEYGSLLSEWVFDCMISNLKAFRSSQICRQDERWHKMRSLVNPVMMKPTTVKLYVPQVDEVSRDFINMWANII